MFLKFKFINTKSCETWLFLVFYKVVYKLFKKDVQTKKKTINSNKTLFYPNQVVNKLKVLIKLLYWNVFKVFTLFNKSLK